MILKSETIGLIAEIKIVHVFVLVNLFFNSAQDLILHIIVFSNFQVKMKKIELLES